MSGDHTSQSCLGAGVDALPTTSLVLAGRPLALAGSIQIPHVVAASGPDATTRYLEFLAASIRNPNTRMAYSTAMRRFCGWCEQHGITSLAVLQRLHVATYIEQLTRRAAPASVKLHLAAIKTCLDYLRLQPENPASGVRGPKHVVRVGRTPVLAAEQARALLESIDVNTTAGARDRALIGLMVYTFARVSAVVGMDIEDYYWNGTRRWVRLREKGSKEHALPLHHNAHEYLEHYLNLVNERGLSIGPLFRATNPDGTLSNRRLTRFAAWEMVKRRANAAGLPDTTTNHSFRATAITLYLQNGGTIENARNIAAHASIRTTQVYDRRSDVVTLDEINRIRL